MYLILFDFIILNLAVSENEIKYGTPMRASASSALVQRNICLHGVPMIYGGIIRTQLPFQ